MTGASKLHAGDWVEVRTKEEIFETLDKDAQLEGLPFMPEMLQHCGQRFQVFKRAHKTCDPPSGLHARRMPNAVHLSGVRCGGEAHGGCQAGCLVFWKEAWLKRVNGPDRPRTEPVSPSATFHSDAAHCTVEDVFANVHRPGTAEDEEPAYVCQSTRVGAATTPVPWWDVRQYVEDLRSGNARLSQIVAAAVFFVYHTLAESGVGLGAAMRWAYDMWQKARGGTPYPLRSGAIPRGTSTPSEKLNLQPGDLVRVRPYDEIRRTLDEDWKNGGLYFDVEQVPFCNGTYRVHRRIEKILDEKTGRMLRLKRDAIVLENVVCQARYSKCRQLCSRSIYPYWREIWLDRVK